MKKIAIIIIAAVILAGCGSKEDKAPVVKSIVNAKDVDIDEIVGVGKVEPENAIVQLATATGGIVLNVFKQEGDVVKMNDVLAQLDDARELLKVDQARSQVQIQESQVTIEKSNLQDIEAQLKNKKKQWASSKTLLNKGAETSQSFDDLSTEVTSLEASLAKALATVQLAQNQLEEMKIELKQAQEEAGKKQLKAPFDGIVLDMKVNSGEAIGQLSEYAEFAPQGKKVVRAEVDELFATKLQLGQMVDIRFTGTEKVVAKGKIAVLSPYLKKKSLFSVKASDQEDRLVREIKIYLEGDTDLIFNEKVECIIHLK